MIVKAAPEKMRRQASVVRERIGREGDRKRKRGQVSAGRLRLTEIRLQELSFDGPAGADPVLRAGAANPAFTRVVDSAVFLGRGKGVCKQCLIVELGCGQPSSTVNENFSGRKSQASASREQPIR